MEFRFMAIVTPAHQAAIANLYIALFARAPDAEGFKFWTEALANGASLSSIARTFVQTPEARTVYPDTQTAAQFVAAYYANVLGRPIDANGLAFWTKLLDDAGGVGSVAARALVVSQMVDIVSTPLPVKPNDISDEAYALTFADRNAFKNKGVVAIYFATEYKGNDLNLAKKVLAAVGAPTDSIDVAMGLLKPPSDGGGGGGGGGGGTPPAGPGPGPGPVAPLIITGTSLVEASPGGAGNDTFNFVINKTLPINTTLNAGDTLSGGAGDDTLIVTTTGAVTNDDFKDATITGIEAIVIKQTDASPFSFNAGAAVTTVTADGGTGNFTFNDLANGAKVVIKSTVGSTVAPVYVAGATDAALVVTGGVTGTSVQFGVSNLTSAVLTSSGSTNAVTSLNLLSSGISALTIAAESNLTIFSLVGSLATGTAVTITGAGAVNLSTLTPSVKSIDASGNAGGLTATLSSTNTAVTIKGSSGNDVITTGSVVLTTGSVDAGAGSGDRLIVSDGLDLSKYSGFEIVQIQDDATVDVSKIAGVTSVMINDGNGALGTGATGLSVDQAAAVTILRAGTVGAIVLGLANSSGTDDLVKATVMSTDAAGGAQVIDLSSLTLAGVERLEVTGNGVDNTTGFISLSTKNATALKSIVGKSTGNLSITIDAAHVADNLVVDASGSTGAGSIIASAYTRTGLTLKAGSGNYTLTGSAAADTLIAGAGRDYLTGGLGNDTFVFNGGTSAVLDADTISDLNAGVDKLQFQNGNGASILVTLTAPQQADVTAATTLATATNLALSGTGDGATTLFSYGGATFVVHNADGNSTFDAGVDYLVKITGYVGVLAATDIVLTA
jgi:hypothetical protein